MAYESTDCATTARDRIAAILHQKWVVQKFPSPAASLDDIIDLVGYEPGGTIFGFLRKAARQGVSPLESYLQNRAAGLEWTDTGSISINVLNQIRTIVDDLERCQKGITTDLTTTIDSKPLVIDTGSGQKPAVKTPPRGALPAPVPEPARAGVSIWLIAGGALVWLLLRGSR